MNEHKRISRAVKVGKLTIGGGSPIAVQSMSNIDTADTENVIKQIKELKSAGRSLSSRIPNLSSRTVFS